MSSYSLQESVFLCRKCGTSSPADGLTESHEFDEETIYFKCPECGFTVLEFWMPNLDSERVNALDGVIEGLSSVKPLLQNVNSDNELGDIGRVLDESLMKLQSLTEEDMWEDE